MSSEEQYNEMIAAQIKDEIAQVSKMNNTELIEYAATVGVHLKHSLAMVTHLSEHIATTNDTISLLKNTTKSMFGNLQEVEEQVKVLTKRVDNLTGKNIPISSIVAKA